MKVYQENSNLHKFSSNGEPLFRNFPQASGATLGKITESTPAKNILAKSVVIPESQADIRNLKRVSKRRNNYKMKEFAGRLLGKDWRVNSCCNVPNYWVQKNKASRGISKNEHGTAYFHGVGHCGSVWVCPVCGQKVMESRRKEVINGLSELRKIGGLALMVTFTYSHQYNDDLEISLKSFMKALSEMKGRRAFKSALEPFGYIGQIRALEVRHSNNNGWHPHTHELWLMRPQTAINQRMVKKLEEDIFTLWVKYATKHGLSAPSREHGIDISYRETQDSEDDLQDLGSYVTKWGHELTYGASKRGKNGSRSPMQILEDCFLNYSKRDQALFVEYANAFKGRSLLFWSKGLKKLLKVEEISDAELSDKKQIEHVINLDEKQWSAIVQTSAHAQVLEWAEYGTKQQLIEFIEFLQNIVIDRERSKSELRKRIRLYTNLRYNEMMGFNNE